jgi:hypothetical protein
MRSIYETADMDDTAPPNEDGERYIGPDVDFKTGELVCPICHKPYSECECNKRDYLHTDDVPEDIGLQKRGTKTEADMDFFKNLDDLLLEEYLGSPTKPEVNQTVSDTPTKKSFSEAYFDYVNRNPLPIKTSHDIERKSNQPTLMKVLYLDHVSAKKSSIR